MTAVILHFRPMGRKAAHIPDAPNRIRELRMARGISQEALAERIGLKHNQIGRLETGQRELSISWMRAIARVFDVPPAELLPSHEQGASSEERTVLQAMRDDERTRRMILATAREALAPAAPAAEPAAG